MYFITNWLAKCSSFSRIYNSCSFKMGKYSKRKKNFYLQPSKRSKVDITDEIGFLATCNAHQNIGVKEGYHLLNHYGDLMYGPEVLNTTDPKAANSPENISPQSPLANESNDEEDDLEASLKKEVASLQAEPNPSEVARSKRRFLVVKCGAPSHIFFRTNLEDPLPLLLRAMDDISATGEQRSKHLIRLLPVHAVCKAYLDKIEKKLEKFCSDRFKEQEKSFYAVVNIKSNSSVKKEEVLSVVLKVMGEVAPKCRPVLTKDADVAIIVSILVTHCYIGEAPEYLEKYRKYNLVELASPVSKSEKSTEKEVDLLAIENNKIILKSDVDSSAVPDDDDEKTKD